MRRDEEHILSVEEGYTRENEETMAEHKMERHVPKRLEKYWTESR